MRNKYLDKIIALRESKTPYATAIIVGRRQPSSGKPGDKAIITPDGQIHGWIGGGCTRGIVLKEALLALRDRKSRLVAISPEERQEGFSHSKHYHMTCQSGGEVEVYIEPVHPKPQILIFGTSHIGRALARLAKAMDYRLEVVMHTVDQLVYPEADHCHTLSQFEATELHRESFVVVCTQGEGDLEALLRAIQLQPDYLAFVSSRKKAQALFSELRKRDITMDQLKRIKTPAGLDLGAKLAEEVAVSILAQIVQVFRQEKVSDNPATEEPAEWSMPNEDYYLNPVCKVPIQKSTAKHVLEYEGERGYFCCDGCKYSFESDPAKYVGVA